MNDDAGSIQFENRLPTAPESIPVTVRGLETVEQAERFGHLIAGCTRAISRFIDLERLDGVTVATDYDESLASLERGFEASRPLQRTADGEMVGVAMAAPVLRDGILKAHMVFYAPAVLALEDQDSEEFPQALYVLAHECAHVAEFKQRDVAFPGVLLRARIEDVEDVILDRVSGSVWEEYAACRMSAMFGGERQVKYYIESFESVVAPARERANEAIKAYRIHGDLDRVIEEAGGALCQPFKIGAYLLGHLHGLGIDLDALPDLLPLLRTNGYDTLTVQLRDTLLSLWEHRGKWTSREEFQPLGALAKQALDQGGIHLVRRHDGKLYVDIPFTPETMP